MWDWYEWDSIEDFNTWHDALCVELGYPLDSYNQYSGQVDSKAAKTSKYTNPFIVEDKVIAVVEPEYADNLTLTSLRLPIKTSI